MSSSTRTGINAKLDRLVLIGRLKTDAIATCVIILLGAGLLLRHLFPEPQSMLAYFSSVISIALVSGVIVLVTGACALGVYRGEFKKTILSLFPGELFVGEVAASSLPEVSLASAPTAEAGGCDTGTGASDSGGC